jgi:hypothetical protein
VVGEEKELFLSRQIPLEGIGNAITMDILEDTLNNISILLTVRLLDSLKP